MRRQPEIRDHKKSARTMVSVPRDTHSRAKNYANREGRKLQRVVADALDDYLTKHDRHSAAA